MFLLFLLSCAELESQLLAAEENKFNVSNSSSNSYPFAQPTTSNVSSGDEILCPICFKQFRKKYNMERHMFIHDTNPQFQCGICGKKFFIKDRLSMHMNVTHKK